MHGLHAPLQAWAAAHHIASAAEAVIHGKVRAGAPVTDEEITLAKEARERASRLLAAMLSDMRSRSGRLRIDRGASGARQEPGT